MLYALFHALAKYHPFFAVFDYITLRAVLACITALIIGWGLGPWVIRKLTAMKMGEANRTTLEQHKVKVGTPSMGGILILGAILISSLLWADWSNRFLWVVLIVTAGFGMIGWVDDYRKVVYKNPLGMKSREKFFWQTVFGIFGAIYLAFAVSANNNAEMWMMTKAFFTFHWSDLHLAARADLLVPFFKHIALPLGMLGFMALTWCVIVGASNAVNLTDGLDGLAILPAAMIGAALGIFAYVLGRVDFSAYLLFPYVPGASEVMVLTGALAGAALSFLWYNAYPAKVFMGDVGALSLGAMLGCIAVIVRQEIVFFIMAGIYVAETVSVMLQVSYFRITRKMTGTGKRIFKMAPLHHHFEMSGWTETQVVVRFWIITMLLVLIGLSTLKLR